MRPRIFAAAGACVMLSLAFWASAQNPSRDWQAGKLVETEQTKVPSGSTKNTSRDYDNNSSSSHTTTTEDYDTYQNYTIDGGTKIYVARERLLFPWSKPATTSVGEQVKFAVEKGKLYLMGDDGKEHKTSVVKVSMKGQTTP